MKKKHKYTISLAVALVFVMTLSCIAFAANSTGLLRYLFEGREPTQQAQDLIVEPKLTVEKNGLRLSIDEYIRDGNTLTVLWSVESTLDQPVFYGSDYPELTPRLDTLVEDSGVGFEELILLSKPENGIRSSTRSQSTMRYMLNDSVNEELIRFDLNVRFFTPEQDIVKDNLHEGISGETSGIIVNELGYTRPTMYAKVEESRKAMESDIDVFTRLGYVKPLEELSLSLEIEPDPKDIPHTMVEETDTFEFDAYTLIVDTMDFSTASSIVKLCIIPKEDMDEDEGISWHYVLTDGQGNDIMADMSGGWNGYWDDSADIQKFYWEGAWGPLTETPESVTIMPVEEFYYAGNGEDYYEVQKSHYITDDAVTIQLRQMTTE